MSRETLGIIGGGQLGRMLTEAAEGFDIGVVVLDPTENCPAVQVGANQILGRLDDQNGMLEVADAADHITWEIEHICVAGLSRLQRLGHHVEPSPESLAIIQNKYRQKLHMSAYGIPVAPTRSVATAEDLAAAYDEFGQVIIKTRRGGYDGRGNAVLQSGTWEEVIRRFGIHEVYAEQIIPFKKELSVVVARDASGLVDSFPVVETIQENSICKMVLSPAPISEELQQQAVAVAEKTVGTFVGAGVFAIEMFLTEDDKILVNEVAPRVHNSGHHTIEANETSQFEQHVLAVTNCCLGSTAMLAPAAAMINILGERDGPVSLGGLDRVLELPDTFVHLYGKSPTKIGRKMGHITVLAETIEAATATAIKARKELTI